MSRLAVRTRGRGAVGAMAPVSRRGDKSGRRPVAASTLPPRRDKTLTVREAALLLGPGAVALSFKARTLLERQVPRPRP